MYGLTPEGFKKKSYNQIREELVNAFTSKTGMENIDTDPESIYGQIIDILAGREYEVWELVEDVFFSAYPDSAEGIALDFALSLNGIRRLPATKTFVQNLHLFGTAGDVIPQGTQLYIEGDPDTTYSTTDEVTLAVGQNQIVELTASKPMIEDYFQVSLNGATTEKIFADGGQKHKFRIDFSAEPANGSFQIDINGVNTSNIDYNATATDIQNTINTLSFVNTAIVEDVSSGSVPAFEVTLSYLEYTVSIENNTVEDSSSNPVSITTTNLQTGEKRISAADIENAINNLILIDVASVVDNTAGNNILYEITLDKSGLTFEVLYNNLKADNGADITLNYTETQAGMPQGTVDAFCDVFGDITCEKYQLTEVVSEPNLERAINYKRCQPGNNIEQDSEVKIRRRESLAAFAAGTVAGIETEVSQLSFVDNARVVENDTCDYVGGVPPKSFETFVTTTRDISTSDADKLDIAQAILSKKPAGIQSFGDIQVTVYDNQNYPREISFSQPQEVEIYLTLNVAVTDDITDFESFSEQLRGQIVEYGNNIGVGKDVIVYPYLSAAMAQVHGLLDVVIDIGRNPSPSGSANVSIDDGSGGIVEVSKWVNDATHIEILEA